MRNIWTTLAPGQSNQYSTAAVLHDGYYPRVLFVSLNHSRKIQERPCQGLSHISLQREEVERLYILPVPYKDMGLDSLPTKIQEGGFTKEIKVLFRKPDSCLKPKDRGSYTQKGYASFIYHFRLSRSYDIIKKARQSIENPIGQELKYPRHLYNLSYLKLLCIRKKGILT